MSSFEKVPTMRKLIVERLFIAHYFMSHGWSALIKQQGRTLITALF